MKGRILWNLTVLEGSSNLQIVYLPNWRENLSKVRTYMDYSAIKLIYVNCKHLPEQSIRHLDDGLS